MTTGTTPQLEETWNWAVFVPKEQRETSSGFLAVIRSDRVGQDVQTPAVFHAE